MNRKVLMIFGAQDEAQNTNQWLVIDSGSPGPRYVPDGGRLPIINKADEIEFWCFDPDALGSVVFKYYGTDPHFFGIDGLVEDNTGIRLKKTYTATAKIRGISQYTEVSASWNSDRLGAGNLKGKLYGSGPTEDPPPAGTPHADALTQEARTDVSASSNQNPPEKR